VKGWDIQGVGREREDWGRGEKGYVVADVYMDRTSDIRMRNASMWSSRNGLRRWTRSGRRRVGSGVTRRVRGWREVLYIQG